MARPRRALRLVVLFVILLAAVYVVFGSKFFRQLRGPGVRDVSEILEGEVTEGQVTVRGIVDEVIPAEGVLFLKDVEKYEVCIDSVCLFAVIKVRTRASFQEGEEAVITGLIAYEDGFPCVVAR